MLLRHNWEKENPVHYRFSMRSVVVTLQLSFVESERILHIVRGKKCQKWKKSFIELIENSESVTIDSIHMKHIEKFVVRCFSKTLATAGTSEVNEARKILFTESYRGLENIPPTKNALYQMIKRTISIASFMLKQCLENNLNLSYKSDLCWKWHPRLNIWVPYWTDLPDARKGCRLFMSCGYLKGCVRNCKCSKIGICCGSTCKCRGKCMKNEEWTLQLYLYNQVDSRH